MKNFRNVLSKTVAPLYFADTYGSAICGYRIKRGVAKTLGKFYQKPLRRFTSQTRMPTGIRGYCASRSIGFQTTGMQSIPEHRIKRGVAL